MAVSHGASLTNLMVLVGWHHPMAGISFSEFHQGARAMTAKSEFWPSSARGGAGGARGQELPLKVEKRAKGKKAKIESAKRQMAAWWKNNPIWRGVTIQMRLFVS